MTVEQPLTDELENFLSDLSKKPETATGYYPPTAGEIEPARLEREADLLESDPRVKRSNVNTLAQETSFNSG